MRTRLFDKTWTAYAVVVSSVIVLTIFLKLVGQHVNSTTVGLVLLLDVLCIATRWGSLPALVTSLIAVLCFNYFFLPPFGTFNISSADNWVALAAFLITALIAGQLSASAKNRAEEAEAGKTQIENLYSQLQDAFDRASQAEALRQSERLKSALLDAVTHDLRTPLTTIKASITTLLDDQRGETNDEQTFNIDPDAKLEMMEVIDQETDRLTRFISGLIELARIEAGQLQLRRRWGAVEEIVSNALSRAEPITRDHRIELRIEKDLPVVRVDERAVSEVVFTLIDNAAKYSPTGSRIIIRANQLQHDQVRMEVENEGETIPPALRERVFDRFFRATRDGDISTHQPSGTGMGLAIAKGLVEAHGGKIWIESGTNGTGTKVAFILPIGDEEPTELLSNADAEAERKI
ncbi:MAG TPA: ATP-binding protein [Pyrinomonadaceae bacterium]|nr:ATP-binding protein [Pyrinomonadaceae bacterium]